MEFGVHLPLISFHGEQRSIDDLLAFTEAARDLGYTHLCANDHLVFARPWLDGPTALAAVLARSGEMTLATTVAVPVLRGPAATAKILAAIDLLSGQAGRRARARFVCARLRARRRGFEERWKRLDEAVQTLRAHWRADGVAFEGAFYSTAGFTLDRRRRSGPARRSGSGAGAPRPGCDVWRASPTAGSPRATTRTRSCSLRPGRTSRRRCRHESATSSGSRTASQRCGATSRRTGRAPKRCAEVLAPMLNVRRNSCARSCRSARRRNARRS